MHLQSQECIPFLKSHFTAVTLGGVTKLFADGYSGAGDYAWDTITLRNLEKVAFFAIMCEIPYTEKCFFYLGVT